MSKRFTYYGGIQGGLLPYLTAYWTADNIATDVHVNNLGGAWNSSSHYATGINGEAFDFGSGNQTRYVDVPDNDLLSFTDGTNDVPFTINMWVLIDAFSSVGNWVFSKRGGQNVQMEYQLLILASDNTVRFAKYSNFSTDNVVVISTPVSTNQWFMITYTDNGTKFGGEIYINGINQTASKIELGNYIKMLNGNISSRFGAPAWINSGSSFDQLKHRGMIDEVAIFNGTELTQLQVQDLYNGGVGKFYPNI